ncbi:VWA domain-containing protein [Pontibacter saemangeumensis]|uniref:VWA domain-containing protein n=2 Tax=Pontibacter saemangeumensis TaxID=1084525 RepID=A0ABP8M0C6_9BACT
MGEPAMIDKLVLNNTARGQFTKLNLTLGAVVFLSIALAGPKVVTTRLLPKAVGANVIFVIDVSLSMLAEDVAPNRLEKAKYIVSKAVDKLPQSKVAVVVFSGVAFPLVPLTSDHLSVQNALHATKADMLPVPGSSLEHAVKMAVRFKAKDNAEHSYVFLISDGEDHTANLNAVIDSAANSRLKIFTLGLGTRQGSTIPTREPYGKLVLKKDHNGRTVYTSLREQALKTIARRTDGKYLQVLNTQDGVNFITSTIKEAESTASTSKAIQSSEHIYQWLLGTALVLILFDSLLS